MLLHIQITVIVNEEVVTTLLIRCGKRLSGLTSSLHLKGVDFLDGPKAQDKSSIEIPNI